MLDVALLALAPLVLLRRIGREAVGAIAHDAGDLPSELLLDLGEPCFTTVILAEIEKKFGRKVARISARFSDSRPIRRRRTSGASAEAASSVRNAPHDVLLRLVHQASSSTQGRTVDDARAIRPKVWKRFNAAPRKRTRNYPHPATVFSKRMRRGLRGRDRHTSCARITSEVEAAKAR